MYTNLLMRIIGFDCADKSLGVCVVDVNPVLLRRHSEILVQLREMKTKNTGAGEFDQILEDLDEIYSDAIKLIYLNIFDTIPGKKVKNTNTTQRVAGLKGILYYLDKKFSPDIVLIEFQMRVNAKSNSVCSCLLYHYSSTAEFSGSSTCQELSLTDIEPIVFPHELHVVGASVKNTIYFSEEGRYTHFIKKYSTNYAANKAHSRFNLHQWLKIHNQLDMLQGIKKANWDDVGDAFMMIMGWLNRV